MNCEDFENQITDHLDGVLAPGQAAAFNEHRLECLACRELLDDVTAAVRMCAEEPEIEAPLGILSKALVIPALNPPIDCRRCQDLVTEFLDGYLEPAIYHAFEDHVNACSACSDTIAGVALAVAACHSVHFSENLEVPESVVARILAETSGAAYAMEVTGGRARIWARLQALFGFGMSPVRSQRIATAGLIVMATYGLYTVNGGSLWPEAIYHDAARLSAKVYSKSAHLAGETGEVFAEVDRIKSRVDELFGEDEQPATERPEGAEGDAERQSSASRGAELG
jgi:hypothetical protein